MSEAPTTKSIGDHAAEMAPHLAACWDRCAGMINPPAEKLEEVRQAVMTGWAQLWPGERSVIVTQCVNNAKGRAVDVCTVGGDVGEIMPLLIGVTAWARTVGATALASTASGEWAQILRLYGFTADADGQLRKAL